MSTVFAETPSLSLNVGFQHDLYQSRSLTQGSQVRHWIQGAGVATGIEIRRIATSVRDGYWRQLVSTASHHSILDGMRIIANINQLDTMTQLVDDESSRQLSFKVVAKSQVAQHGMQVVNALSNIEKLSGFTKREIAEDLIVVSRETINNWANFGGIRSGNLKKLLAVEDVLNRAHEAQSSRLDDDNLRSWLSTPRGETGVTPQQLIQRAKFDRARLLAMTIAPSTLAESPMWLKGGPSNADAEMVRRVLDIHSEKDYESEYIERLDGA